MARTAGVSVALPKAVPARASPVAGASRAGVLTFRPLHESPLLAVHGYCCRACREGPAAEERSDGNEIVLLRHGAFAKHFGRKSVTVDVNQVAFFSKDAGYRISHPIDCGDRGTVFALSPRVLDEMVRELDPRIDDHPDQPFPFVTSPCSPDIFWRHREIAQRLGAPDTAPPDPLRADVILLDLVARVLEAAFARHGQPRRRQRSAVAADHADRAEAAKAYLASRLGERVTLHDVAEAVHASPFHFARAFRSQTGIPIHRYLTHLRLRNALQRLAEGADDLSALAVELGFASHSHFCEAFRREFGLAPSDVRREARVSRLRELSKIPKA